MAALGAIVSGQTGLSGAGAPGGSALPAFGSAQTSASNAGSSPTRHVRFLRKIPIDPMTGKADWGMRSVSDDPDASSWGGKDVFDVYSLSTGMALDGTNYKDW